jgi:pimeloyl-ACP methyl ester carboxylesterase
MSMTPSSSGGRLHVLDRPGGDPAFVLMHGFPDDHHIYDHLAPLLSPRRVVTFDFFGYGRSGRAADAGEHVTPAQDLTEVIQSPALHDVVLVGHDASGPVAINYTLEYPGQVRQLVLLDTYFGHAPALRLPEMIRLFADHELAPLADAMVADPAQLLWLLNHTARQFFGTDELPPDGITVTSVLPQFFAEGDNSDALAAIRAWTGMLFADLDDQDARIASGQLKNLDVPVTLIFGADDAYLSPDLARHLAEHFTRSDMKVVPNTSHWPQGINQKLSPVTSSPCPRDEHLCSSNRTNAAAHQRDHPRGSRPRGGPHLSTVTASGWSHRESSAPSWKVTTRTQPARSRCSSSMEG